MNFAGVQSVTIPEGDVKSIAIGGVTVWTRPFDAEIEYLESSGTQYVDTGFIPTAQTSFEIECSFASSAYGFSPFAYSGNAYNSTDTFGACRNNGSQRSLGYRGSSYNFAFGDNITNLGSVLNLKFLRSGSSVVLTNKTSGQTATVSVSSSFVKGTRSLYVFSGNSTTTDLTHPTSGKLYFFKMYDGSTLVRDYVPVRVGSVGYLFDRVSGQLFGNAGTGDFVLGPDKNGGGA